ncbi:MAG: hypothetical protein AB7J28_11555 [Hyphomonadaceae bacterium]
MLELALIVFFQAAAGEPNAAAPAREAPSAEADAAAREERDGELDQVICRQATRTGTRLGTRLCMTRRDQIQIRRRQQEELRRGTLSVGQPDITNPAATRNNRGR